MDLAQPPVAACVAEAAAHYGADRTRLAAYFNARKGKHGEIRVLPNGEIEIGLTAIPGKEVEALQARGITPEQLKNDACLNVAIGTYLVRRDEILSAQSTPPQPQASATAAAVVSQQVNYTAAGPSSTARPKKSSRTIAGAEDCISSAATRYHLPLPVFKAVLTTEGGWDGLKKRNTNGSFDMGRAQINTIHLPELSKFGITEQALVNDACTNVHVAAYRLRFEINRVTDFWQGVGNYHSRTPHLNRAYRSRVETNLSKLLQASK